MSIEAPMEQVGLIQRALDWMRGPQTAQSVDRRAFLRVLGGTAAGVAIAPLLDLDKLLWVPKPIVTGFCGRNFVIEALRVLENNLTLVRTFNRQYDDEFPFVAGDTIYASRRGPVSIIYPETM